MIRFFATRVSAHVYPSVALQLQALLSAFVMLNQHGADSTYIAQPEQQFLWGNIYPKVGTR